MSSSRHNALGLHIPASSPSRAYPRDSDGRLLVSPGPLSPSSISGLYQPQNAPSRFSAPSYHSHSPGASTRGGYYSPASPHDNGQLTIENSREEAEQLFALAKSRLAERVYTEFRLSVLEYQRRVIGCSELISRVRTLFDGYIDLVQGFRRFVPDGYLEDYDNWRFGTQILPREFD